MHLSFRHKVDPQTLLLRTRSFASTNPAIIGDTLDRSARDCDPKSDEGLALLRQGSAVPIQRSTHESFLRHRLHARQVGKSLIHATHTTTSPINPPCGIFCRNLFTDARTASTSPLVSQGFPHARKDGTKYNRQSGDWSSNSGSGRQSSSQSNTNLQRQQQMRNQDAQRTQNSIPREAITAQEWAARGWEAEDAGAEARLRCLIRDDAVDWKNQVAGLFCEASIRRPPVRESSALQRLWISATLLLESIARTNRECER